MMTSHLTPTCKFATENEKEKLRKAGGKERRDIPVFGIAQKGKGSVWKKREGKAR